MQPKIHKKGNPGQPVVISVNFHTISTTGISKYVDYHLQPIVKDIPSYVRDTKDFLTKLNHVRHKLKEILLVTLDVKSLYTNIPTMKVLKLLEKLMTNTYLKQYLSLILTLNNFIFNCSHYIQVMGCAMATICAQAYANIFMPQFEAKHIYPYIHGKALLFLRYIIKYLRNK